MANDDDLKIEANPATVEDSIAIDAAFKAIMGGDGAKPIRSDVAVSRAGALLSGICRMTSNPEAAMRFAITVLKSRLDALKGPA